MKKLILATAISALSVPAFAADIESLNKKVDVYGDLNITYKHVETTMPWADENDGQIYDNGSTIGVYGEHEIAPGVTGFARAEITFNGLIENETTNSMTNDDTYVGVKGAFGKVWVGKDDSFMSETIDHASNFYEVTMPGYEPESWYTWKHGERLKYSTPTTKVLGGDLTLNVGLARSDVYDMPVWMGGQKSGQSWNYEVGFQQSYDRIDLAAVISSNRNKDGAGTDDSNHHIGLSAAVQATDNLRVTAAFIERQGSNDFSANRFYSLMSQYTAGKMSYTLSYHHLKDRGNAETVTVDKLAGQIGYHASESLFLYAEAAVGDVKGSDPMFGTPNAENTLTAVGVQYSF